MNNKSIKIAVTSEQLAAEYRAGATIRELAAKYGCSFQNINIRVQNAGVAMRPVGITKHGPAILKQCPTCGKTFKPYRHAQTFCCVDHIRQVTVCKYGHPMTEDNRYHYPGSQSRCKICCRARNKASYERRKQRAQS